MIALSPALGADLRSVDGVHKALQQAMMLEHATIPAYLYAMYSLAPGVNDAIRRLIASVVKEEMSHMALAANILNAVGGAPVIDDPAFVPAYPGRLPGAVEAGVEVRLMPFSLDLVQHVFMEIEEPEEPLEFPVAALAAAAEPLTIGTFYRGIAAALEQLGDGVFTGDRGRQVTHKFGSSELIAVTDVASAKRAIELIVEQGEGTTTSPLGEAGDLAHYYRFAEIYHGKALVPNPDAPPDAPPDDRYVYAGAPIAFDPHGVLPAVSDPKAAGYPAGSQAQFANDEVNYTYTSLLKALHATFDGQPERLGAAIGLMESIKVQAIEMMSGTPVTTDGHTAGPSFEYLLSVGG